MRTRALRRASSASRLPALDALRGIAVLMVLFDHAGFGGGSRVGGVGVGVSIVISGYPITGVIRRDLAAGGTVQP